MYLVGTNDGLGVNNNGLLSAQHKVTVDSTGRVVNTGTIATGKADIKAESLEQDHQAKFYADNVAIQVGRFEQKNESVVLTRNDLSIAGNQLINSDKSLIKTEGQLEIGKSFDRNGRIVGKIDSIENQAATIEAGQKAIINAEHIENRNGGISLKRVQIGESERVENEVTVADYPGQTFTLSDNKLYYKRDLKPDTNHVMLEDENIQFYIDGHGKDDWTRYKYTKTHEKDVVEQSSPARIISGGAMQINAERMVNDASQISAAGELVGNVKDYIEHNPESMEYTISKGEAISYSRHRRDGHDSTNIDRADYNKIVEKSTKLPVSVYGSHITDSVGSHTIDASILNSISRLATNPNTTYVIETDPNFTSRHTFLSSDYVLSRLNLEPMNVQKRLGDGYYEQQLVMQDILHQTGKSRLAAGLTAEEQYRNLMDEGIRLAKSQSIVLGRGLTELEQQDLRTDVVLLVSKAVVLPNGMTETVLVPTLYLAPTTKRVAGGANVQAKNIDLTVGTLHNSGSIVADEDVTIRGASIENETGLIKGTTITIVSSGTITNTQGTIEGAQKVSLYAENDIVNDGGRIIQTTKDGQLVVSAKRDIMNSGKEYTASDTNIVWDDRNKRREVITSIDKGEIQGAGNVLVEADRDVVMKSGAIQTEGSATVVAKRNVELGANSDSRYIKEDHFHTGKSGGGNKVTTERHDEATITQAVGSSIEGESVHISAGNVAALAGSDVLANDTVIVSADTVSFATTKDSAIEDHSLVEKKKSIVKRERTDQLDHVEKSIVNGSTVSGKEVYITSNRDVKGESVHVLGQKTLEIQANNDVELDADKSISDSTSLYRHKKSGLLGGAGIGFSIGKEKLNIDASSYEEQTERNILASTDGTVHIEAGGKVHITSGDIVSNEGTRIEGADVTLDGNIDHMHDSYSESYKKTGLTVSLGGALTDSLTTGTRTIKQAGRRDDKRLAALELNEARKQLQDGYNAVDKALHGAKIRDAKGNVEKVNGKSKRGQKNIDDAINVSVSIGSTSRKQSQIVDAGTYQGGTLISNGDVNIIARDANAKGITLTGERGQAQNIIFDTASDLQLKAGKNVVDMTDTYKASGWSVGAGVSLTSGSLLDINASANMARQNGETHQESYVPTSIKAVELAHIKVKRDVNSIGSTIAGKQVQADIGKNLTIQSLQDVDNFKEHSKSAGFSISSTPKLSNPTGSISASKGRIDSTWRSVTEQASLQAGEGGYDISVGNRTSLEGALITSQASKEQNKLITKELELKDIHNEAEYEVKENGVQYTHTDDLRKKSKDEFDKNYKYLGLTPTGQIGAYDKASSTTKSAISEGIIQVNGQVVDVTTFNTDVDNALNELQVIFDRKKIEERQALANLFSKNANEAIHEIAKHYGWKDGDPRKVALHGMFGGISAKLGGNSFVEGAYADGLNEALLPELKKRVRTIKGPDGKDYVNPADLQTVSYILGYATNKTLGYNPQTGSYVAYMGTKYNAEGYPIWMPDWFAEWAEGMKQVNELRILEETYQSELLPITAEEYGEALRTAEITGNKSTFEYEEANQWVINNYETNKLHYEALSPTSNNYGFTIANRGEQPSGITADGQTYYNIADEYGNIKTYMSYKQSELDSMPSNIYSNNYGRYLQESGEVPTGISNGYTYFRRERNGETVDYIGYPVEERLPKSWKDIAINRVMDNESDRFNAYTILAQDNSSYNDIKEAKLYLDKEFIEKTKEVPKFLPIDTNSGKVLREIGQELSGYDSEKREVYFEIKQLDGSTKRVYGGKPKMYKNFSEENSYSRSKLNFLNNIERNSTQKIKETLNSSPVIKEFPRFNDVVAEYSGALFSKGADTIIKPANISYYVHTIKGKVNNNSIIYDEYDNVEANKGLLLKVGSDIYFLGRQYKDKFSEGSSKLDIWGFNTSNAGLSNISDTISSNVYNKYVEGIKTRDKKTDEERQKDIEFYMNRME